MDNWDDYDIIISFPVPYGHSNAILAHKAVLAMHSNYFKNLFDQRPDITAYQTRRSISGDDIRAIVKWMYNATTITEWPYSTCTGRLRLARMLKMQGLSDTIRGLTIPQ